MEFWLQGMSCCRWSGMDSGTASYNQMYPHSACEYRISVAGQETGWDRHRCLCCMNNWSCLFRTPTSLPLFSHSFSYKPTHSYTELKSFKLSTLFIFLDIIIMNIFIFIGSYASYWDFKTYINSKILQCDYNCLIIIIHIINRSHVRKCVPALSYYKIIQIISKFINYLAHSKNIRKTLMQYDI